MSSTNTSTDPQDVLLSEAELASRWGYASGSLKNQRSEGRGLPFVRIGRTVRYRLSDVLAYEHAVSPDGHS